MPLKKTSIFKHNIECILGGLVIENVRQQALSKTLFLHRLNECIINLYNGGSEHVKLRFIIKNQVIIYGCS